MNVSEFSAQIAESVDRGARPISFGEINARAMSDRTARLAPARHGHARRVPPGRRTRLGVTVAGLTAAGTAAALVAASQGGGTAAVLTAATLKQMATASQAAMTSGEADIVWHAGSSTVVQHVTFDSANWNDVNNPGQPLRVHHTTRTVNGHTYQETDWTGESIERVVDGQDYHYPAPHGMSGPVAGWVHQIGAGGGSLNIPDPRSLVSTLSPSAGFVNDGSTAVNGVSVQHLRATTPAEVALQPLDDVIQSEPDNAKMSALDLWVDSSGVVLKAEITVSGTGASGSAQSVTVTVTFSHIGQPQNITTPTNIVATLGQHP